ncbi:MAG: hypothetical protein ACI8P0_001698 [Planctomycetaceae bacterium]|jgi:hypothetical protein
MPGNRFNSVPGYLHSGLRVGERVVLRNLAARTTTAASQTEGTDQPMETLP